MSTNYYVHLRLSEERTREGLRKAELNRHVRAARTASKGKAPNRRHLAITAILSRLLRSLRTNEERLDGSGSIALRPEPDQDLA